MRETEKVEIIIAIDEDGNWGAAGLSSYCMDDTDIINEWSVSNNFIGKVRTIKLTLPKVERPELSIAYCSECGCQSEEYDDREMDMSEIWDEEIELEGTL